MLSAIAASTVAVAFRKPDLTRDQGLMVRDFVGQQIGKLVPVCGPFSGRWLRIR
jgi:hypothetical protein